MQKIEEGWPEAGARRIGISFWSDENILELDSGNGFIHGEHTKYHWVIHFKVVRRSLLECPCAPRTSFWELGRHRWETPPELHCCASGDLFPREQSPWGRVGEARERGRGGRRRRSRRRRKIQTKGQAAKDRLKKRIPRQEKASHELISLKDFITPVKFPGKVRHQPAVQLPLEESEQRALLLKKWSLYNMEMEKDAIRSMLEARQGVCRSCSSHPRNAMRRPPSGTPVCSRLRDRG